MNSTIGRYILALVIGGGVFGGLTYVNRDTGNDVALPAVPQVPAVPAMQEDAPDNDAGTTVADMEADVAAGTAEEETADAVVPETPAEIPVAEEAEQPAEMPEQTAPETGGEPANADSGAAGATDAETPAGDSTEVTPPAAESPATETDADTGAAGPAATVTPEPAPAETENAETAPETPETVAPVEAEAEAEPVETQPDSEAEPATEAQDATGSQTATVAEIINGSDIAATVEAEKPTFDVVRVDNNGMAVIAGTAAPNTTVIIKSNGKVIGEAVADSSGEFVAIVQMDDQGEAQNIALETEVDGQPVFSDESILVLPTLKSEAAESAPEETPPVIVKATEDEVVVVQSGAQPTLDQISIDSVSYEETGEASVAGRGTPGNTVIVYVDNEPMDKTEISASGTWKVILDGVEAGKYTLRADEIGPDGEVASRMETPFQRAFPAEVQQAQEQVADAGQAIYTVQPGNSLWVIATGRYGEGLKYHQIFAANRDQIRDPDLIYPGQVFVLPDE